MVTKRQLGFILIGLGALVALGAIAANAIGARDADFGPFQAMGVGAGLALIVAALPLIGLGDRPA